MAMGQEKDLSDKTDLHPRNKHRSRYDFKVLLKSCPELSKFVFINKYHNETIDFSIPDAVKLLNKALLKEYYKINYWDIPANYLCPPIPGRADYIHYIADLLGNSNDKNIPEGKKIKCLDIGTGANCVYPIIGNQEYGWSFVGSEIDDKAIRFAKKIVQENDLKNIEIRKQVHPSAIFVGIIKKDEVFDVTICNPPFHASAQEAQEGTLRKVKNLNAGKKIKPILNFGGQNTELWCEGGELQFITKMIKESASMPTNCFWFTSLVSKSSNLKSLYYELEKQNAVEIKTIEMKQGNKISRFVAWTFLNSTQQKEWKKKRFTQ